MKSDQLQFPVLCIHQGTIFTVRKLDELTGTTTAALNGGLFKNLRIIDSNGMEVVVVSAKKLHGIGPFFGFNIFLNQRIRVSLEISATGKIASLEDVRGLVLKEFRGWHGWQSRGDFELLTERVREASSVGEILSLVTQ